MMAYDGMLWIMIYGHYHSIFWHYDDTMRPLSYKLVYKPHEL